MISRSDIKRESARQRVDSSLVERDYIEGWMLRAIADSSISKRIAFKGGTALSRIYYWGRWRHSEDLDFAAEGGLEWGDAVGALRDEVPAYLSSQAQIHAEVRGRPHTNPVYTQIRMKYTGPLGPNTIKVEMTRSAVDGVVVNAVVPGYFDCPEFTTRAYSLETVMAEKVQALVERGYARDYYDVWKLLKDADYDAGVVRRLFAAMCRSRGTEYGIGNVGADGVASDLEPYLKVGLYRLVPGAIPPFRDLVGETRSLLSALLGTGPPP